jgi:aryl-alcohol dehydrogenase-like predicted oxidoreductase
MQMAPPGTPQTVLLGTAQWGLDYGITNPVGRPDDAQLAALVDAARQLGLTTVDTAPAYGDAEERIGRSAPDFAVQTKVSAAGATAAAVLASVQGSLRRLQRARVRSCLVHDWSILDAAGRAAAATGLHRCREQGLVEWIGVSAYTAEDLQVAAAEFPALDVVQVPVSVLDQRLENSPALAALRRAGVRIQARSVFLQGLALADHAAGQAAHADVVRLGAVAREEGRTRLALCLGYVRSRSWLDEIVVAATSPAELREIAAALDAATPDVDWAGLASHDDVLLDPRRWTDPVGTG